MCCLNVCSCNSLYLSVGQCYLNPHLWAEQMEVLPKTYLATCCLVPMDMYWYGAISFLKTLWTHFQLLTVLVNGQALIYWLKLQHDRCLCVVLRSHCHFCVFHLLVDHFQSTSTKIVSQSNVSSYCWGLLHLCFLWFLSSLHFLYITLTSCRGWTVSISHQY